MASITIIPSIVFKPPALGKPNPKLNRCNSALVDDRKRVLQKGSLGGSCQYHALKRLAPRIKAPNTEAEHHPLHSLRKVEKALSVWRKSCLQLDREIEFLNKYPLLKVVNKNNIKDELSKQLIEFFKHNNYVNSNSVIKSYLESTMALSFHDYLVNEERVYSVKEKLNEIFFRTIRRNAKEAFDQCFQFDLRIQEILRASSERDFRITKLQLMDKVILLEFARRMYLRPSSWTPNLPFEDLLLELETHGPLCVAGHFGRQCYKKPAEYLKTIDGREVRSWKKGDRLEDPPKDGHAIILVGAEETGKAQLVYYIDPVDESSPNEPEPIYAISYGRLTDSKTIFTLSGLTLIDPSYRYALRRANQEEMVTILKEENAHKQLEKNQKRKAQEVLEKAIKQSSSGYPLRAIEILKSLRDNDQLPFDSVFEANISLEMGLAYAKVAKHFETVTCLEPIIKHQHFSKEQLVEARLQLGIAYRRIGRVLASEEMLKSLITTQQQISDEVWAQAGIELATFYHCKERHKESMDLLNQVIKSPRNFDPALREQAKQIVKDNSKCMIL